jgi:hypothetical protein
MIELVKKALQETGSDIQLAALLAFIAVESGGKGFDPKTGKIMIQFEPHIFSNKTGIERSLSNHYIWDENKIDLQPAEWKAFNDAFKVNPDLAMESTSIGLPQIMGFHWKRLGFNSVGAMWDYFKVSELNQVKALIKFIETDKSLIQALVSLNWDKVASIYNGKGYKALALKLKREPYDITMSKAYNKYKGKGL